MLSAQIESLVVERVRDLRIGLSPSKAAYIKSADFAVAILCCLRSDVASVRNGSVVLGFKFEGASAVSSCPIQ